MGITRIKSIRQAKKIAGKRVLLRADLNIPLKTDKTGNAKITDEFKIIAALPTIRYLLRYKCKIIIVTHLGRPTGSEKLEVRSNKQINFQYSVKPVATRLSKILGVKVKFIDDCVGFKVGTEVNKLKNGEILMLENLRYYSEEKNNDLVFAKNLSKLADLYINDAFAVCHRKHASVAAIKKYLPAYAGLLLEKEIASLNKVIKPKQPLILALGGAKLETKMPLINKIGKKANRILIGGALANSVLAARGIEIGQSLADKQSIAIAKKIKNQKNIILPIDVVVKDVNKKKGVVKVKNALKVEKNDKILDIGPETVRLFAGFFRKARTIIWNGPMGSFEEKDFKYGTLNVARAIAIRSRGSAFGAAGGGETIAALKLTGMMDDMDWVSTGGGAMLAYLGGEKMPGLQGIVN